MGCRRRGGEPHDVTSMARGLWLSRFLRLAFWLMPGPFHDVWFGVVAGPRGVAKGLAIALAHGLERQGVCCSRCVGSDGDDQFACP